ncbi:ferritin-like domain-containing protein [Modestobacter lapidis]|nr:ferritin-like domain-containing protein [Modestobacter lapidis]
MADGESTPTSGRTAVGPEEAALQDALAAAHVAVWGYGVVGAALPGTDREPADVALAAHRDVRDEVAGLLDARGVDPVPAEAAYALPFPVLSPVDAAALAVTLEDGVAAAWAWVLDQAGERSTRAWAVVVLADAEVRAVAWRAAAGLTPVTTAFPGLPGS